MTESAVMSQPNMCADCAQKPPVGRLVLKRVSAGTVVLGIYVKSKFDRMVQLLKCNTAIFIRLA